MTALDVALVNARVRTLDPAAPFASAVGVAGGRIAVVGRDDEVRELAGASTEVVDLKGAAVVPGIVDSHLHPFAGAAQQLGVDLSGARTIEQVRELLAAERANDAPDRWVLGFGLGYDLFTGTGIDGELLADAVRGGPALLTFVDFHTALATPRALELAGVSGRREFDEHAEVVVDPGGRPTGELRESAAMRLVRDAVPPLDDDDRQRIRAAQLRRLAAVGITGAHGMDGGLATPDVLRALEADGDLVTRLVMPYWVRPETPHETWEAYATLRDEHGGRWRTGVAKLFLDGVIDSGTSWLFEPDSEGEGLAPFWPTLDAYREAVGFFATRGFQVVTHATGDRAVHEALNAYRDAGRAAGVRHRVEHVETLDPRDLPRFAAEQVVASMQPQHMMDLEPDRSDNWSRRLGPERCARAYPTRSLLETGAIVPLGSDWPIASYDWREGMAAAQLRRPPGAVDRAPYDQQGIGALSALHGYTTQAALAVGAEDELGRIRAGWLADLTVLAVDPVDCPPDGLVDLPVLLTIVDGEIVFRAASIDAAGAIT